MFTLAEMINITVYNQYGKNPISTANCKQIYTTQFKLSDTYATGLCTNSTMFNWTDTFNTSVALANAYLYGNYYNP